MSRGRLKGSGETPDNNEYINAANYAYTQPDVSPDAPTTFGGGLTILTNSLEQPVYKYDANDGFYAVAFKTQENQIIVAFEGTNFFTKNAQFTAGQVVDDADITAGRYVPCFTDAMSFTRQTLRIAGNQHISKQNVFLCGHSLGAADAEYVAAQTGMSGTTFGTPGISSKFFKKTPSDFTNYVEYGDPVGNYDVSANSPIQNIVTSISPLPTHYGTTVYVGKNAEDEYGFTYLSFLKAASSDYKAGDTTGTVAAAAELAGAVPAHFLTQYVKDVPNAAPLYDPDHSFGSNLNPLCFAQGTRIATPLGAVPVEALMVGDRVTTLSGADRTIRWLGHRTIAAAAGAVPWSSCPVRVLAGSFGDGLPVRDLLLSPGHPVLVGADADGAGGTLVPVMCLENGTTISRVAVDSVTYWHVELDAHDILLAEGLPAESYVECGDRAFFDGADDPLAHPDLVAPGLGARCRPVAVAGVIVDGERRRLDAVFATRLASACDWPDDGNVVGA